MGVQHLAVLVGEQRGTRAVEYTRAARAEARRAGGLDADQTDTGIVQETCKEADRVRAPADARDRDLGQTALGGEDLLPRLAPDHGLQLGHDLGVRDRTDAGPDQVMS